MKLMMKNNMKMKMTIKTKIKKMIKMKMESALAYGCFLAIWAFKGFSLQQPLGCLSLQFPMSVCVCQSVSPPLVDVQVIQYFSMDWK